MPTYKRCPSAVKTMAMELMAEFASHQPALAAGVTIDFVFAYPDCDENGMPTNDALKAHGVKALGLCKVIPADRRAKGEADVEIKLDGDWWDRVDEADQRAVLDHELHHINPVLDGQDTEGRPRFKLDSNGRPKVRLRKHDVDLGWFHVIAQRHGMASIERKQAAHLMEKSGQLYWPELTAGAVASSTVSRLQRLEVAAAR